MSKWMAIGLGLAVAAGAASCSRKESTEAVQEPVKPSESIAGEAADAKAGAGTAAAGESVVAEGADLDKVEERTGVFQNMLDSLRTFSGAGTEFDTNSINLAEFVKGKSEQDLRTFLENTFVTRPIAAKQVAEYLLDHATDTDIYLSVADRYSAIVPLWGTEADATRMAATAERLVAMYAESLSSFGNLKTDPDDWFNTLNSYAVIMHDSSYYLMMAAAARKPMATDYELSLADWSEFCGLVFGAEEPDANRAQTLLDQIKGRKFYGKLFFTEESVDWYLSRGVAQGIEVARRGYSQFKPYYLETK